jgi:hypothetical protein
MNDDDKDIPNNLHVNFNWKPSEEQHPYTFSWFNIMAEEMNEANKHQNDLECELAYLDLVDALIDQMASYPDAEEIIKLISN